MEELVMKSKLALLTIMPSMLWLFAIHNGYSQCDLNYEAKTVAPLYFSYTYNMPLSSDQLLLLEYWMICETAFENPRESCYSLDDWMLNDVLMLSFDNDAIEGWMLSDMLDSHSSNFEMQEWMLGFEPIVQSVLNKADSAPGVEDWMLEFNSVAQQFIQEAFMSIKEWMLSNSFTERENVMDIEDWMIDGLSMN
jgi:hypothetical protein